MVVGDQNLAVLTLEMLASTCSGVTSPITVTFFAAKSMLKDVTPASSCRKNVYILLSHVNLVKVSKTNTYYGEQNLMKCGMY